MSMRNWGGKVSKRRGEEKKIFILEWLGEFEFSTQAIMTKALGVHCRGQAAFFKRMVDDGLIFCKKMPNFTGSVYGLEKKGLDYLKAVKPMTPAKSVRKIPSWIVFSHLISMQDFVIEERSKGLISFSSEKALRKKGFSHLPDLVVNYDDNKRSAIEIELTRKNIPRIYNIFLLHLKNIKNDFYDKVVYVFLDEDLMNNYFSLYNAKTWPIYVEKDKRGRMMGSGRFFDPETVHSGNIFSFTLKSF